MSSSDVRRAMLKLIDALTNEAFRTEAIADELVRVAEAFSGQPGADAIRDTARRQRVRALELRGQLAALRTEYAVRFLPES
ncbi:hypothetical protein GOFOIKOB_5199 [Methylobacterium tardum]|uniref:Uncharacterized protein n=1 Tax=Methylobacterium tardum TaxID=374432 RepID=A0AA37TI26_9HYPH|nr:hypothetical protein [Methylobacterium tardum]URD38113.1 hypothetical protein M6G65_06465 [Methylobacterium tardum]GJE52131.1 hypothetical protein GOFOIKOB_5199 [Methylobacterium tardum]GLS71693.1 hypothetical protein GCM10007890_37060 [Methylobacterium tardum]